MSFGTPVSRRFRRQRLHPPHPLRRLGRHQLRQAHGRRRQRRRPRHPLPIPTTPSTSPPPALAASTTTASSRIANGGAVLNYGVAASYNTTNMTTDLSPITGYGRFKTRHRRPRRKPRLRPGRRHLQRPARLRQWLPFSTTAGGQFEFSNTNAGGVPFYNQDSFNSARLHRPVRHCWRQHRSPHPRPPLRQPQPRPQPRPRATSSRLGSLAGTSFCRTASSPAPPPSSTSNSSTAPSTRASPPTTAS